MIADLAGWMAPAATMIAAMMTAANLGARITGWGFVVFTIGSVGRSIVGLSSGQTNLVATNAFLTLVNGVGIWRWLGRRRVYEDGGKAAQTASRRSGRRLCSPPPALPACACYPAKDGISANRSKPCSNAGPGRSVMWSWQAGGVGGVKETLRTVPADVVQFDCEELRLFYQGKTLTCSTRPSMTNGQRARLAITIPANPAPDASRLQRTYAGRMAVQIGDAVSALVKCGNLKHVDAKRFQDDRGAGSGRSCIRKPDRRTTHSGDSCRKSRTSAAGDHKSGAERPSWVDDRLDVIAPFEQFQG